MRENRRIFFHLLWPPAKKRERETTQKSNIKNKKTRRHWRVCVLLSHGMNYKPFAFSRCHLRESVWMYRWVFIEGLLWAKPQMSWHFSHCLSIRFHFCPTALSEMLSFCAVSVKWAFVDQTKHLRPWEYGVRFCLADDSIQLLSHLCACSLKSVDPFRCVQVSFGTYFDLE